MAGKELWWFNKSANGAMKKSCLPTAEISSSSLSNETPWYLVILMWKERLETATKLLAKCSRVKKGFPAKNDTRGLYFCKVLNRTSSSVFAVLNFRKTGHFVWLHWSCVRAQHEWGMWRSSETCGVLTMSQISIYRISGLHSHMSNIVGCKWEEAVDLVGDHGNIRCPLAFLPLALFVQKK